VRALPEVDESIPPMEMDFREAVNMRCLVQPVKRRGAVQRGSA